ncbi:hypothetical protein [Falsirhodobacter sp. 1013]
MPLPRFLTLLAVVIAAAAGTVALATASGTLGALAVVALIAAAVLRLR